MQDPYDALEPPAQHGAVTRSGKLAQTRRKTLWKTRAARRWSRKIRMTLETRTTLELIRARQ